MKACLSEDEGRLVAAALRVPAGGLHCGLGHHAGAREDRRERRACLEGKQVTHTSLQVSKPHFDLDYTYIVIMKAETSCKLQRSSIIHVAALRYYEVRTDLLKSQKAAHMAQ